MLSQDAAEKNVDAPHQPMFITELMLDTHSLSYQPSVDDFQVCASFLQCKQAWDCVCVTSVFVFVFVAGVYSRNYWPVSRNSFISGYPDARHLLWCFYSTHYQQKGQAASAFTALYNLILGWGERRVIYCCLCVVFQVEKKTCGDGPSLEEILEDDNNLQNIILNIKVLKKT